MLRVVVTIPAHNEEQTIGLVLSGVRKTLPTADIQVVCNHCQDRTAAVAREQSVDTIESSKHGLATAFRTEMVAAIAKNPDVIVHIDSDGQYDPHEIPLLMAELNRGADLVLGHRLWQRAEHKRVYRHWLNKVGAFVYSIMLRTWIPDMTTGFRAFTIDVAQLPIVAENTYTQEQIWRAVKAGYRVTSVPVSFYPRKHGESRLISSAWSYLVKSWRDFRRFV